jgi:UDP-N-acetylglucosamine--dolichyl-phosphate N-acetylglucosaminephosphotransferase
MTYEELVANELKKVYKTNEKLWLDSYRRFPLNVSIQSITLCLLFIPLILGMLVLPFNDMELLKMIGISLIISVFSFYICLRLIPQLKSYLLKCNIFGKDLNKSGDKDKKPPIPEAIGIITWVMFLVDSIIIISLLDFRTEKLLLFMTGLLCIAFMILLGFVDDVVNLRWKYKLILPFVASLALLLVYDGVTSIIVPIPVRFIFGKILELGFIYKLYFSALTIFWTNAINIHAGVNGLEVSQSVVISVFIIIHNIIEISRKETVSIYENHLFSLVIMLPFLFTSLALLKYNAFPSKVFVGDTYTSFAGIVFAVWGILGHFSKTLLLFFIPQIINFLLSLPQLFKFIYCPRHRLPKFNEKTLKLEWVNNHFTLLNATLRVWGPMNEEQLNVSQIIFQVGWWVLGFFIRYGVAQFFF